MKERLVGVKRKNFKFVDSRWVKLNCYKWENDIGNTPKAIVQISHGMSENILRYDEFARELVEAGFTVYGHDHRGHGETAASIDDLGYMDDEDNFHSMVYDLKDINDFIKKENKGIPIILFGHSMGSFLSQRYIELYGDTIDGLILSGSNGKQKAINNLGIPISYLEMKIFGRRKQSNLMDKLSFGSFNNNFKPVRTNCDWLTRDEEEVDKYLNNKYCGNIFTASYFYDLLKGLKEIHKEDNLKKIPTSLNIYLLAGSKDPVGENGKGIVKLYNLYKNLGVKNVSYKLYEGARHEILNETNKDEVINDIKNILEEILSKTIIYA